jgi:nicotinamide riboside kinase
MSNGPRIAIDGAQSTGKTTLWTELQDHYGSKLLFIREAARAIAADFGIFEAADWPSLLSDVPRLAAFFAAEEEWQLTQELSGSGFVSDSSLYLIQAYKVAFGFPVDDAVLKRARYDVLFHCTNVNPFTPDGFRFVAHREQVDLEYRKIITNCCTGRIVELTKDNRADVARAIIDGAIDEGRREG